VDPAVLVPERVLEREGAGYRDTELFQSQAVPSRFLTIDRWDSRSAYEQFRRERGSDYARLDAACEALRPWRDAFGPTDLLVEVRNLLEPGSVAERIAGPPGPSGGPRVTMNCPWLQIDDPAVALWCCHQYPTPARNDISPTAVRVPPCSTQQR